MTDKLSDGFAAEMNRVLLANSHKKPIGSEALIFKLREEYGEVMSATTTEERRAELVDLANVCMLLWEEEA